MSMYVCVYVVQLLCFIAIIFVVLLNLLNCLSPTVSLGSFRVKSPNFQEIPHDPSQMFPKKLLKIPQCVLMTQTKF